MARDRRMQEYVAAQMRAAGLSTLADNPINSEDFIVSVCKQEAKEQYNRFHGNFNQMIRSGLLKYHLHYSSDFVTRSKIVKYIDRCIRNGKLASTEQWVATTTL